MREESGRSLIEIVGVLAIGVAMIVAGYAMYKTIDQRQKRLVASETIEDVAKKVKILYEYAGYPEDDCLNALVDAGALENKKAPIGSGWSIKQYGDATQFQIEITGLTYDECSYFKIKKADWAQEVYVNGKSGECKKDSNNKIQFIAQ